MDLIIKNGTLVSPTGRYQADIGVAGGRIVQIASEITAEGAPVVDAGGKFVLPGAIDAHTHMDWPGSADNFFSGTTAAACGGVTSIVDFAIQFPGATLTETVEKWHKLAGGNAVIDYGFHLAIKSYDEGSAAEISRIIAAEGITSLKMWMTSGHSNGLGVDDGTIWRVMEIAARHGALVGLHCENDPVLMMLNQRFLNAGQTAPYYHRLSRPPAVEAEAIRRVATFAEVTGCFLYIPHLSSEAGLVAVGEAQRRGVRIVAETCPQFLALTDEVYQRPDAARFVMSPPIKGIADQAALWRALAAGDVVSIGSDHCPYSDEMKSRGSDDFTRIPNGVPGVEAIVPLLYGEGVARGRLTLEQMVAVTAENPARMFGLYPRKGVIAPGSDADLVIFDPDRPTRLDHETLHSRIGYSIYADITVPGYPVATFVRGCLVARDGQPVAAPGWGQFLRRGLPQREVWDRKCHA